MALGALAHPASAHEGDARLELEPVAVAPGGGIRIVGEDLPPGLDVRLTIEGLERQVSVEHLEVDPAGHFTREIAVPDALPTGVYGVKASAEGELVASNVLVIDSAAGPGIPVDRSPPWAALGVVLFVPLLLLIAVRRAPLRPTGRASGR